MATLQLLQGVCDADETRKGSVMKVKSLHCTARTSMSEQVVVEPPSLRLTCCELPVTRND